MKLLRLATIDLRLSETGFSFLHTNYVLRIKLERTTSREINQDGWREEVYDTEQ